MADERTPTPTPTRTGVSSGQRGVLEGHHGVLQGPVHAEEDVSQDDVGHFGAVVHQVEVFVEGILHAFVGADQAQHRRDVGAHRVLEADGVERKGDG
eukprot:7857226-Pyramimonas_sp.AAC.1